MSRSVPEWRGLSDDTPVPGRVRVRVYVRDGGCCQECGRKIRGGEHWVCDHRIAIINGGQNIESNLRTICDWCDKNLKTPADVAEKSKTAAMRAKHLGIKKRPAFRHPTLRRKVSGDVVAR